MVFLCHAIVWIGFKAEQKYTNPKRPLFICQCLHIFEHAMIVTHLRLIYVNNVWVMRIQVFSLIRGDA